MIDAATGFDPSQIRKHLPDTGPVLRCPTCNKEQPTAREKTDPKGTKATLLECPACFGERAPLPVRYLDKNGKELTP